MTRTTVPTTTDVDSEIDRQLTTLVALGYPALLKLSATALRAAVDPIRDQLTDLEPAAPGGAPLLLVANISALESMPHISLAGKPGFVSADIADIDSFTPIDGVEVPAGPLYAVVDVQRGDEYSNWSPDEALPVISERRRTPLTVAEGVALATHFPAAVEKNNCFMLLASRCGDRRVPAVWISGGTGKDGRERRGAPKIGWCWAGNRHTWLGHASAARRIG